MARGHIINQVLQEKIERKLESEGLLKDRDENIRKRHEELQILMQDKDEKIRLKEFRVSRSVELKGRLRSRSRARGTEGKNLSVSKDHKDKIKSDAAEYKAKKDEQKRLQDEERKNNELLRKKDAK